MIQKSTIDFLKALKKNNNKDWFDRNKEKYLAAKANVDGFVDEVITLIAHVTRALEERLRRVPPKMDHRY